MTKKDTIKYLKRKRLMNFIALGLNVIAIGLALYWYDWKLIVIMFIWFFANNISQKFS